MINRPREGYIVYWIGYSLCWVVLKSIFRLRVYGLKFMPPKGGFIVAANHFSYLDPVVIGVASPRPIHFVAKKELFKLFLFAKILHLLNTFPVDRRGDLLALKETLRRLSQGAGVAIFPEGTRGDGPGLQEPRPGVALLASKSGVPVVPAYIRGTDKVLPRGAKGIRFTPIKIVFGPPLYFGGQRDYRQIAKTIMVAIAGLRDLSGIDR